MFSKKNWLGLVILAVVFSFPLISGASVESSLSNVQEKLVGTILPLVAILGFVFAGFSYVTGNPNARNHLVLAIIGAVVGFGSSSIVAFLRGLIQ